MADLSKDQRDKLPLSDFGDPENRKYPVTDANDVKDAYNLAPAGSKIRDRIVAIAKRKGLTRALPDTAKEEYYISMAENDGTKHTHIKKGGGQETHDDHAATAGHTHDGMLPLPAWAAKKANMGESAAVVSLMFNERVKLAERVIPYVRAGQWTWDDYGTVPITEQDCADLVQHFNEHVREDSLPIINEEHDSHRAVGWVKELVLDSPGVVKAVAEFNPVGEQLVANDEYRFASAQLLRNYIDAETGKEYGIVAAGLDLSASNGDPAAHALTNKPRIKHMGRIAASEGTQMSVLAFSDRPIQSDDPFKAADVLVAENAVAVGAMEPRVISTADISSSTSEGQNMADKDKAAQTDAAAPAATDPATATTPPATEAVPTPAATATGTEDAPLNAANFAETNSLLMAERNQRRALEVRLSETQGALRTLQEQVAQREADDKVKATTMRLSEAKRRGKISPAEFDALTADPAKVVKLAEDGFYLDAIEARPAAVNLAEVGSGDDAAQPTNDNSHLVAAATKYVEEQGKVGNKISFAEAARHVARTQGR